MSSTDSRRPLHSTEYINPARSYWWNADFLALMGQRWKLSQVRRALDVGCGVGHWSAIVGGLLNPAASLIGVDREPAWAAAFRAVAAQSPLGPRRSVLVAGAEALPFPSASFDFVTCQTLLIHVADARVVLREMMRVLAPGGLLAVVEPSNRVQALLGAASRTGDSVETLVERTRFVLRCERGRAQLGEGRFSLGDELPELLVEQGLTDVRLFQSDKPRSLIPPYTGPEQQAFTASLRESGPLDAWLWRRDDARRYHLAGGGDEAEFATQWARLEAEQEEARMAARANTHAHAGGQLLYLASGRKRLD